MTESLSRKTAVELASLIATKAVSPVEVLDAQSCCDRACESKTQRHRERWSPMGRAYWQSRPKPP